MELGELALAAPRRSTEKAEILAQQTLIEEEISTHLQKHADRPVASSPCTYTFQSSPLGIRLKSHYNATLCRFENVVEFISADAPVDLPNVVDMEVNTV